MRNIVGIYLVYADLSLGFIEVVLFLRDLQLSAAGLFRHNGPY